MPIFLLEILIKLTSSISRGLVFIRSSMLFMPDLMSLSASAFEISNSPNTLRSDHVLVRRDFIKITDDQIALKHLSVNWLVWMKSIKLLVNRSAIWTIRRWSTSSAELPMDISSKYACKRLPKTIMIDEKTLTWTTSSIKIQIRKRSIQVQYIKKRSLFM